MTEMTTRDKPQNWSADKLLFTSILVLVVARFIAILASPLELGVDEAQYWLWGQELDFGYYSKPPLIGWVLAMTDALFGSSAAATRSLAPFLHLIIAGLLWHIGQRHFSLAIGRWAALFWISLPIVSLGSFVISTDSILLVPWVMAFALFLEARAQGKLSYLFASGLVIGFGLLAKYAAIYFVVGAVLTLLLERETTSLMKLRWIGTLIAGALISFSPNLIWNIANGGITFSHLGENADLSVPDYSLAQALEFLVSQSAVSGPLFFILFCAALLRYRQTQMPVMLLWFCLPVLGLMTGQAYLKTANANWAATAWPAACLITAGFVSHLRHHFWARLALSINLFAALFALIGLGLGDLHHATPQSDPLRRLRGWEPLADMAGTVASQERARIIIADRRAEAALLSWHLADTDLEIKVRDSDGIPGSHFELTHALSQDDPKPYIIMIDKEAPLDPLFAGAIGPIAISDIAISEKRNRVKAFYVLR